MKWIQKILMSVFVLLFCSNFFVQSIDAQVTDDPKGRPPAQGRRPPVVNAQSPRGDAAPALEPGRKTLPPRQVEVDVNAVLQGRIAQGLRLFVRDQLEANGRAESLVDLEVGTQNLADLLARLGVSGLQAILQEMKLLLAESQNPVEKVIVLWTLGYLFSVEGPQWAPQGVELAVSFLTTVIEAETETFAVREAAARALVNGVALTRSDSKRTGYLRDLEIRLAQKAMPEVTAGVRLGSTQPSKYRALLELVSSAVFLSLDPQAPAFVQAIDEYASLPEGDRLIRLQLVWISPLLELVRISSTRAGETTEDLDSERPYSCTSLRGVFDGGARGNANRYLYELLKRIFNQAVAEVQVPNYWDVVLYVRSGGYGPETPDMEGRFPEVDFEAVSGVLNALETPEGLRAVLQVAGELTSGPQTGDGSSVPARPVAGQQPWARRGDGRRQPTPPPSTFGAPMPARAMRSGGEGALRGGGSQESFHVAASERQLLRSPRPQAEPPRGVRALTRSSTAGEEDAGSYRRRSPTTRARRALRDNAGDDRAATVEETSDGSRSLTIGSEGASEPLVELVASEQQEALDATVRRIEAELLDTEHPETISERLGVVLQQCFDDTASSDLSTRAAVDALNASLIRAQWGAVRTPTGASSIIRGLFVQSGLRLRTLR